MHDFEKTCALELHILVHIQEMQNIKIIKIVLENLVALVLAIAGLGWQ